MFMIWNLLLGYNSSSLVIFYFRYRPQSLGLQFLLLYLSIQLIPSYSPIFIHPDHPILLSYIYPSSSSHPTLLYLSVPLIPSHSTLFYLSFSSSHLAFLYLSVTLIPFYSLLFICSTHPILLFSIYSFSSSHPTLLYLPFHSSHTLLYSSVPLIPS